MKLADMVSKSALVLHAKVTAIDDTAYDFDTKEALTKVDFAIREVLAGSISEKTISIWMRGGLLPNGKRERWSLVPEFVVSESYVMFLRNGEYFVTPFVTPEVFRELRISGDRVLVDQDGWRIDTSGEYPKKTEKIAADTTTLRARQRGESTEEYNGANGSHGGGTPKPNSRNKNAPADPLAHIRALCRAELQQKSAALGAKKSFQTRPSKASPELSSPN